QIVGILFPESLESDHLDPVAGDGFRQVLQFLVHLVRRDRELAARLPSTDLQLEQRWYGRVDAACLEKWSHIAPHQGEQQAPDVVTVSISVCHQDELP